MLPEHVRNLVDRVLTSRSAESPLAVRRDVFEYVAALVRERPPTPGLQPQLESYVRKVALHAYKVLDRDVDAMRDAGAGVDVIFEATVVAAVSAGATRLEIALAALEEVADAPAT